MLGKKKSPRELQRHRDNLARREYCRQLGAERWKYHATPTYYYNLWERYLQQGDTADYPWDHRLYPQQREADMFMAQWIHQIYRRACGLNVTQLEINFEQQQ